MNKQQQTKGQQKQRQRSQSPEQKASLGHNNPALRSQRTTWCRTVRSTSPSSRSSVSKVTRPRSRCPAVELVQTEPRAGKRKPIPKEEKKQAKTEAEEGENNANAGITEEKKVEDGR